MSKRKTSEDLTRPWHSNYKQAKRRKIPMECTPEEFRSKLEYFFRPYILSARSEENFDRACFRMASHDFSQHLRSPELACVYYSYVVQECCEFISVDKRIMFTTLKECITRKMKLHGYGEESILIIRSLSPDDERIHDLKLFPRNDFSSDDDDECDYYRRRKNKPKTIEVPHWEVDIKGCTLEQLLYKTSLYQDFECVKNLLLYIMPVTFVADDLYDYSSYVIWRIGSEDPSLKRARYCDTLMDMHCKHYSAWRMKLLLMSVDFVIQKRCEDHFSQNSISNLKLLVQNIPDARITSEEVSRFLLSIVKDLERDAELLINDFCRSFEEVFPESDLASQPRSLKSICRYQIRRSLSLAQQLPVGIERLGIPTAMKKYLSLE